jgi:fumarate hydratase class II
MVCAQVMGNQTTVSIAGSNGHFEVNNYNNKNAYEFVIE